MSLTSFVRGLASAEVDRVRIQIRSAIRSVVLAVVAAVFLVIGLVFAMAGAYASLAERMPSWEAGGIVGLAALVVCLILLMMSRRAGGGGRTAAPPPPRRGPRAEDLEASAELGAAASTAARDFVRDHRPTALQLTLAAFVVGMVTSRSRRKR